MILGPGSTTRCALGWFRRQPLDSNLGGSGAWGLGSLGCGSIEMLWKFGDVLKSLNFSLKL